MLKEKILERKMTLEDSKNYLIASVYIKTAFLFEGGFGWDPWEDGRPFHRNLKISVLLISSSKI